MSKQHNKNGLFVDTGYLRDHVYQLRQQKKLAARLYENVAAMKHHSDPSLSYQYYPILQDVETLMEYFQRMANVLAEVDDDVVQLRNELGKLIESDTDRAHHTISNTLML